MAAKQKNDLHERRDAKAAELAKAHKRLQSLQQRLRGVDPQHDGEARMSHLARVNEAKDEIAKISHEHGELSRAAALVAGCKNFFPGVT